MREAAGMGDLDLGFELLERGDLEGASAALERARRQDPEGPEVLCLAGALAGVRGDVDRALALLSRASELDPEYPLPLIEAAELELYSRDDPQAAQELATRALAVAELEEDLAGALLLCAEASYSLEEDAAARECLEELGDLPVPDPALLTRAGNLLLALGDLEPAEAALSAALELEPKHADAHHALGRVFERRGDRDQMVRHWLETRRLDRAAPRLPWHFSPDEFEEAAEKALAELPREILDRLENVPILMDDVPSEAQVRDGNDPRLLGLFSGVPYPHKSHVTEQAPVLDAVHLFQRNLERETEDREDLIEQIRITVAHETAHFFGLEDEDLEDLGLG